MAKDLTTSDIHRQNILNNRYALTEIDKEIAFPGIFFEGEIRYTRRQISQYYDIDDRTTKRYLTKFEKEFSSNGYDVLTGSRLKAFKESYDLYFKLLGYGRDIDVPTISKDVDDQNDLKVNAVFSETDGTTREDSIKKTSKLGVFNFRSFLNIGMLLTESEKARQLRALILDIVIDTINAKIGGNTKYINQQEEEFLPSAIREFNYRETFTKALKDYIEPNKWKYAQFTDAVYKSIFHENAKEYKQILKLKAKDSERDTMYSEVLDLIAGYENGFAAVLMKKKGTLGKKLSVLEAQMVYLQFEETHSAAFKPLLEKARSLMASRDMEFRDALHEKLKSYLNHLSPEEFEKFLGEKSMILEEQLMDNIDVFKRLKNR